MSFFKKINTLFYNYQSEFELNIKDQRTFMNNLNEPKNLIERSYLQYKCQNYIKSYYARVRNNIFATIGFVPFIALLLIKTKRKTDVINKSSAIIISSGIQNLIPDIITKKFIGAKKVDFGQEYYLYLQDLKFFAKFPLSSLLSPYYLIKSLFKVAMYRAIIDRYDPKAIICSSEYSFTSSLLTYFCEINEIEHINVMHGEKFFNIRDAFCQFHQFHVWDEYYINLFVKLRADINQFVISIPPSLILKDQEVEPIYELTYYLADESEEELKKIRQTLLKTIIKEDKICIRFHPRFINESSANIIFNGFVIENPLNCSLDESFNLTKRVVSLYSTVLFQGYKIGKKVIVDDVTRKDRYKKLEELEYIMVNKPHIKLSQIIEKNNDS